MLIKATKIFYLTTLFFIIICFLDHPVLLYVITFSLLHLVQIPRPRTFPPISIFVPHHLSLHAPSPLFPPIIVLSSHLTCIPLPTPPHLSHLLLYLAFVFSPRAGNFFSPVTLHLPSFSSDLFFFLFTSYVFLPLAMLIHALLFSLFFRLLFSSSDPLTRSSASSSSFPSFDYRSLHFQFVIVTFSSSTSSRRPIVC